MVSDARRIVALGIETSCDETAAALVGDDKRILSNLVLSQLDDHRPYGGVVPEIAARAHVAHLTPLIDRALGEAGVTLAEVDLIAATAGPGLIGGVMVGLVTAKALAFAARKPLYAINHLEGHALSPRLVGDLDFPYLLLLISGGHCQLLRVGGPGDYRRLGTTIDDAAGEAYDKVAKLLGLGYPGGPAVEKWAEEGDASRFKLPRPLLSEESCDFSFSGLKTAVAHAARDLAEGDEVNGRDKADLCAAFEAAIGDCLIDRAARALDHAADANALVVAGGVAANLGLRARLHSLAEEKSVRFVAPPLWLCTDNAAMIAWAGLERRAASLSPDGLDFKAQARWPLDEDAMPARGGVGRA